MPHWALLSDRSIPATVTKQMTVLSDHAPHSGVDRASSWVVAVAACLCMVMMAGVSLTAGMFHVVFLEAFNEGHGYTALITSLNYGFVMAAGEF